jgi:hypothetical protein
MSKERKGEKEHRRANGNRRNEVSVNGCKLVKQAFLSIAPQYLGKKGAYLPCGARQKKLYECWQHQKD